MDQDYREVIGDRGREKHRFKLKWGVPATGPGEREWQ